jgi:putative transposase
MLQKGLRRQGLTDQLEGHRQNWTNFIPGNYDYSHRGFYFVTVCIAEQRHRFGRIHNEEVILSTQGEVVEHEWLRIPQIFAYARLDAYIFMPNHMHGIIELLPPDPAQTGPRKGLSEIMGRFKGAASYHARRVGKNAWFDWQDQFHDRIIWSQRQLQAYRNYIATNPRAATWKKDRYYPERTSTVIEDLPFLEDDPFQDDIPDLFE